MSVVLPTLKGQTYLAAALDSVCQQSTGASIDVVAVDDGSTDSTVSIVDSYSSRLAMNIIRLPRRGNWVANTLLILSRYTIPEKDHVIHRGPAPGVERGVGPDRGWERASRDRESGIG